MPVQITIIGLGRIGASMGLALSEHKNTVFRVGHDKDFGRERAAGKKGAVDKTEHNLPAAVKDARLIVLALPVNQIRETLQFIAPDLMDGTVVVDTAPVKSEVMKWAKELLPEGCYYVGLVPTVGPEFLLDQETGPDSAKAGLFTKSIFLVDAPAETPGEAVELASDLVRLLGGTAMLTDTLESDGLMASAHLLPQLISAALLEATVEQPGWKDRRKLAGQAFIAATSALGSDVDALHMLSMHNRENTIRALDTAIAALREIKDDIEQGNEKSLAERLKAAKDGRANWLNERASANWVEMQREPTNYPSMGERLFGSVMGRRSKK